VQDEGPVARLGEKQFAGGLFQGALLQGRRRWEFFGQFRHARLRDPEMGINPLVALVEPDAPIAFLTQLEAAGIAT